MPKTDALKKIKENFPSKRFYLGNLIAWTLFGFLASAFSYVRVSEEAGAEVGLQLFLFSFTYFYIWGVFSIFIYFAIKLISAKNILKNILLHLPFSFFLSLFHSFLYFSFVWLIENGNSANEVTYLEHIKGAISLGNFILGLIGYGLTAISVQAVLFYQNYRVEEAKNLQLQNELSKAQLQALKMQLQPHFLFNTLHSISSLNLVNPNKANEMIALLGEFLRTTLDSSDKQFVTLDEELGFIRHYLEIEEIRFNDRLKVKIETDENVLSVEVPHLILQPLVENAVKHGISPFESKGKIHIEAKRKDKFLQIEVIDELIDGKNEICTNSNNYKGRGLENVRQRLKQIFETDFECNLIQNSNGNGHRTYLKIPIINE